MKGVFSSTTVSLFAWDKVDKFDLYYKLSGLGMKTEENESISRSKIINKIELYVIKAIITVLLISGFVVYRSLFLQHNVVCIRDAYQDATLAINRQLVTDTSSPAFEGNNNQLSPSGKAVMGIGQILMDGWILIFGILYLIKIKNLRGFGSIAIFYLTKAFIFLNIQRFPITHYYIWKNPGFTSYSFSYSYTSDFFYSGHVGTLTTLYFEMTALGLKLPALVAFLSMIFMMNFVVVIQAHYTADIIGGFLFAAWYHRTVTKYVIYIDQFFNSPFVLMRGVYRKIVSSDFAYESFIDEEKDGPIGEKKANYEQNENFGLYSRTDGDKRRSQMHLKK